MSARTWGQWVLKYAAGGGVSYIDSTTLETNLATYGNFTMLIPLTQALRP